MHQRAAAGRDIHDQRAVRARIITVRRRRLLAKERLRIFLVGDSIFEQPDVENLVWILRKEILLQLVDGPFDCVLRVALHHISGLIADYDEGTLNDHGKAD